LLSSGPWDEKGCYRAEPLLDLVQPMRVAVNGDGHNGNRFLEPGNVALQLANIRRHCCGPDLEDQSDRVFDITRPTLPTP
jgi:hypothetical protein